MATKPAKKTAKAKAIEKTKKEFNPPPNDNITPAIIDLVPEKYRGTDKFLDIVNWNIRYFNPRDPKRVRRIASIMETINADMFTLLEIEEGALEPIIDILNNEKAGYYKAEYGTTGGDQRVAIMYDTEWIRAKEDVKEIFSKKEYTDSEGKDAFPRLPLRGYFTGLVQEDPDDVFDFQLIGLHLKSQRGDGSEQRKVSADALANWLSHEAGKTDADVIMLGDWNKEPTSKEWNAIHRLESKGLAKFKSINDSGSMSHLMYQTKKHFGSLLDLTCVSMSASKNMAGKKSNVVRWKSLDAMLANAPTGEEIKTYIKETSQNISDHMPVFTRFYFKDKN